MRCFAKMLALKDIGYVKEVLGGIVVTDDGLTPYRSVEPMLTDGRPIGWRTTFDVGRS